MDTQSITTAGRRHRETQETTEDVSAVLIPVDHRETTEVMAVVPTTMTEMPNLGITSPEMETSGEGDHEMLREMLREMFREMFRETLRVEIRSMTKRAMVEEDTGEIVPRTVWTVEELLTETSTIIGLAWETKVIDGTKDTKKCTTEEVAIAVGMDAATITTRTQENSIEIQGHR